MHLEVGGGKRLSTNKTNQQEVEGNGRPHISVTKSSVFEILKWTTCHISERVTYSNDRG